MAGAHETLGGIVHSIVGLVVVALATGAAGGTTPPRGATADAALDQGTPRARLSLVADASAVTPGDSFAAGVLIELDPGWHIYWKNPGEAGLATKVEMASANSDFGELEWPNPSVFSESDGLLTT